MEYLFVGIILVFFLIVSSHSNSDLETVDFETNSTASLISPLGQSESYLRRGALPPSNQNLFDRQGKPLKEYRLEDFMWTGSGDGPLPADPDEGLAWDDGQDGGHIDVIHVTKTMVLYSTVITRLYPVELTPTIVISTPVLPDSSNLLISSNLLESSSSFQVSQSISSTMVLTASISPTASVSPSGITPIEEMPSPSPDLQPESSNIIYWVNTVIKANTSNVKADSPDFQEPMEKNLAKVYASAFKRHLLSSLGLMKRQESDSPKLRKRRSTRHLEKEDLDFEWMFLKEGLTRSQIQSLATTTMNVSVSIVNITSHPSRVSMNYIVSAEGNPIPGSSAVQDLDLVTKSEMEDEIGYEVIKKAEALVTQPSRELSLTEKAETSPWLIVAIAAICAFVISLFGLTYLAWKAKRSSISDESHRATRPQSGIEGGVINPAFLGSPGHTHLGRSEVLRETAIHKSKDRRAKDSQLSTRSEPDFRQREQRESLATELTTILTKNGKGEKVLPSVVKNGAKYSGESSGKSSSGESASPQRRRLSKNKSSESEGSSSKKITERPGSSVSRSEYKKDQVQKRRRRKTGIVGDLEDETSADTSSHPDRPSSEPISHQVSDLSRIDDRQRPLSASRDKITLGHLDICEDTTVRSTDYEREKKGRHGSGSRESQKHTRRSQSASSLQLPETIDEVSDLQSAEGGGVESLEEKDREIGERFEPSGIAGPSRKDAQVQTPTRSRVKLKTKAKPKPKTSRNQRLTSESVFLSESEDYIETILTEDSSGESNPLGRMRKRFHRFLDDAFNVMGRKDDNGETDEEGTTRPKSAKVSISHEIQKRETQRPYTTHVIHEESLERLRPKSATIRPPMRAWTDSSDRRCHSAKSISSRDKSPVIMERAAEDVSDFSSTSIPTTTSESSVLRSHPIQSTARSNIPLFPNYPIYPDIPMLPVQQGPSHAQAMTDPAVPLINAIKEEIKRFEKVKVKDPYRGTNV